MTTVPMRNCCHWTGRPMESRPVFRTLMTKTPMIVPHREPTPPASDVPPMTQAAIAYISWPLPVCGVIAEKVAA